jgi:hypothetical protein
MPEDRERQENRERNEDRRETRSSSEGGSSSETRDLKEREYRDKDGNIHHHTHTSEEMKDKKAS